MELVKPYSLSHLSYKRIPTREVMIGNTPMGGNNPIRIQSMTTTDTMDTIGTVEQTLRMVEAGCEYVRITAPSKKEAANLAEIKKELRPSVHSNVLTNTSLNSHTPLLTLECVARNTETRQPFVHTVLTSYSYLAVPFPCSVGAAYGLYSEPV